MTPITIASLDPRSLPASLTTRHHLILNTPATIDFNSPGAQGFGVKRAGLTVPGSLMLLISPACCGRNTRALSGPGRYGERFAYLELSTTDIVTGAHLQKIPEAARLFLESRTDHPTCLLLCTTCVDALLGTDMDRIARKTEALIHLPTRPCYMYALTRESLHPPMVQVRETIASLLEPSPTPPADKEQSARLSAPHEPSYVPQADKEQSDCFRPLGAPCSAKTGHPSGRRGLCDSERSGEHPSGAEKTNKAALKKAPSTPLEHTPIAREDSPLSESAQSPRPTATTNNLRDPDPPNALNLLGYFSPLSPPSDLFPLLRALGYPTARQLSTCRTYAEFQSMAASTLTIVLHPESLPAAEQLATRLHIPYITLRRFYTPGRIHKQYQALAKVLGKDLDDTPYYEQAKHAIQHLRQQLSPQARPTSSGSQPSPTLAWPPEGEAPSRCQAILREGGDSQKESFSCKETEKPKHNDVNPTLQHSSSPAGRVSVDPVGSPRPTATTSPPPRRPLTIALGSRLNADPLDLALLLTSCGFTITDIITTLSPSDTYFLTLLKDISPSTRLHGALDPSMADFAPETLPYLTLGADAATYYPGVPNIPWNQETQPFGYQAPLTLLKEIRKTLGLP